jgi:hypothetical protein
MSLLAWCEWLQHTRLATAIGESNWLFPFVEGSHILTLPLAVGMVFMFDLRLLGLAFRGDSAGTMVKQLLRWSWIGFAITFLTGGLLFITQADKAYNNAFFRAKLILLVLLGINAVVYHRAFESKMTQWDSKARPPLGARFCGGLSLVFWIAVIFCGRTMAYQF